MDSFSGATFVSHAGFSTGGDDRLPIIGGMIRWIRHLIFAVAAAGIALAGDLNAALTTLEPMRAAASAGSRANFAPFTHMPDYGYVSIGSLYYDKPETLNAIIEQIITVSSALGTTLRGVDGNEWAVFALTSLPQPVFQNTSPRALNIVLRVRAGNIGTRAHWEVWMDGRRQR